jgi:surface carbohydrate biosynthesis protein (TIGR04326 family)
MAPPDAAAGPGGAFLVWDAQGPPPPGDWTTVLWSAFGPADGASVIALPRLVEDNAAALRARYLAWIHDLGQARVAGARIIDHLELRPGFSYWWMTLVAHKPNFYESYINDVVKCLAFDTLARERGRPTRVAVSTDNRTLARLFEDYCRASRIPFERIPPSRRARTWAGIGAPALLAPLKALALLAFLAIRRLFAGAAPPASDRPPSRIAVFDVLIHLQPGPRLSGRFGSQYWTELVSLLRQADADSSWLHIFFPHADVPSLRRANTLMHAFTTSSGGRERHGLLDGALTLGAVGAALRNYLRLARVYLRLRAIEPHFTPAGSGFNFWPVFRRNWRDSLIGAPAMRNCTWISLFDRALAALPRQSIGLYILENQPWEMAMLHAWRAAGHGRIIGVPHTTVRFWDLRYYYDPRGYRRDVGNALPMPDTVAVNGPAALQMYLGGGYPAAQVVEVEALRYLHLQQPARREPSGGASPRRRVLICGDNLPGSNARLMRVVAAADRLMPRGTTYVFKPHKALPFDVAPYVPLPISTSTSELAEILDDCDVVITGNVTSAAVDAYCAGLPLASMEDGSALDPSPFKGFGGAVPFSDGRDLADPLDGDAARPEGRGLSGVETFTNAAELGTILERLWSARVTHDGSPPRRPREPFFWLDPDLPRWRTLLEL